MDPYSYVGFIRNADDSITRIPNFFPTTAASADPSNPVLTKDVPINQETGTWARLYLPRPASAAAPAPTKLPVIVYYHGGGFIVGSAASNMFQKFLSDIALHLPAVVVSVEYRLAPEHRLPAAYDDGAEALHWLKSAAAGDEWLSEHADMSNCYLMGTSAGGNLAYHVGLRAAVAAEGVAPVKIRGLILHHPFFGGEERTPSEIRLVDDKVLPPRATDMMWALALPDGADRDHHYCNPMKEEREGMKVEKMKEEGWRVLITCCNGDPLVDRQMELAGMMREKGLNVIQEFSEEGFHGVELIDDAKARSFYGVVKNFLLAN